MEFSNDPVSMATVAPGAPVTSERPIRSDLESSIPKPYMARAMVAPDMEHPDGTADHNARGLSVVQQHAAFFDQDNDGIIYPWETYTGCQALGFNIISNVLFTFFTHLLFSYPSLPGYIPSLLFPIYIANVHKCKHPSVSGTYDTEGRYVPANFENMFSKYGKTTPNKLTFKEIWSMTSGNRVSLDIIGWILNKVEWVAVYLIAKDEEGYLSKEAMRGVFDGSLFDKIAKRNATKGKKRR
ncbi:probable peroxygenase 3 [Lactuca sativa]|uniref:probable peroxygenase 3 n=1 Tax=Lactuca sativa TaxID=4236 RepID=UPI000CB488D7|nr:probable peroxygenase 3 [Lactuca sativa]